MLSAVSVKKFMAELPYFGTLCLQTDCLDLLITPIYAVELQPVQNTGVERGDTFVVLEQPLFRHVPHLHFAGYFVKVWFIAVVGQVLCIEEEDCAKSLMRQNL
jgi:hypothetical protein